MFKIIDTIRFGDMLLLWYRIGVFPVDGLMQILPYSDILMKQLERNGMDESFSKSFKFVRARNYPYGDDNELKICLWCSAHHIPVSKFFDALDVFMRHRENKPLVMAWLETLPLDATEYLK